MATRKYPDEHQEQTALSGANCGIYAITNAKNGKRYIGSAVNIARRWKRHRTDLRTKTHHSVKLQRSWDKHGEENFVFEVLELVEEKGQLINREQFWIDDQSSFLNGYNSCPVAGSHLGVKQSKETIEKRAQKLRGHVTSEKTKEKIRESNRVAHNTPEMKLKHSIQSKGRTHSDEAKAQMSKLRKGRPFSKEVVERRQTQNYFGRVPSEETRKKLSDAKKNQSAETRKKISEARTGFKMTEEQKIKLSMARKAYLQAKKEVLTNAQLRT